MVKLRTSTSKTAFLIPGCFLDWRDLITLVAPLLKTHLKKYVMQWSDAEWSSIIIPDLEEIHPHEIN